MPVMGWLRGFPKDPNASEPTAFCTNPDPQYCQQVLSDSTGEYSTVHSTVCPEGGPVGSRWGGCLTGTAGREGSQHGKGRGAGQGHHVSIPGLEGGGREGKMECEGVQTKGHPGAGLWGVPG